MSVAAERHTVHLRAICPEGAGRSPGATRRKGFKRDGYLNTRARQVLRLVLPQAHWTSLEQLKVANNAGSRDPRAPASPRHIQALVREERNVEASTVGGEYIHVEAFDVFVGLEDKDGAAQEAHGGGTIHGHRGIPSLRGCEAVGAQLGVIAIFARTSAERYQGEKWIKSVEPHGPSIFVVGRTLRSPAGGLLEGARKRAFGLALQGVELR